MIIEGFIVVGPCAAGAVLIRLIFKWGNKGRRARVKRERSIAVPLEHVQQQKQSKAGELSEKEKKARKRGRRRMGMRALRGACRYWTAWAIVVGAHVAAMLTCMIFSSQSFGESGTQVFLVTWATTLGIQLGMIEPMEVAALVFFPRLFDNKYVGKAREIYKDYFM